MIQRIQTIWLLLAAVCALLTLKVSFFSGNKMANNQKHFESLTVISGNLLLLILSVTVAVAALVIIFLYKDRKMQLKITLAVIALSIGNIALFVAATDNFVQGEGSYDITAPVVFAVPVLLILAARGIYKDEKLVKSVDRLR